MLTYADPQRDVTIRVAVPPGAVTSPVDLELVPLPPPLPTDLPVPPGWLFGPPFGLNALINGTGLSGLTFTQPATVTLTYSEQMETLHASMDFQKMQLRELLDSFAKSGPPSPWQLLPGGAGCGAPNWDLENNTFETPLCELGSLTGASSQRAAGVKSVSGSGARTIYAFIVESHTSLYLPLIRR